MSKSHGGERRQAQEVVAPNSHAGSQFIGYWTSVWSRFNVDAGRKVALFLDRGHKYSIKDAELRSQACMLPTLRAADNVNI
mgnify:CR=1 FL=1